MKRLAVLVVMMLVVGAVGSGAVLSEPAVAQETPESGLCDAGEIAQFGDVGDSDYAAAYILCMRALGLSVGFGDGDYGPGRELNRGQMATFLIRLWTEQLGEQCPSGVVVPFTDTAGTTHEANIECLFGLGITQGTSATTYSPQDPLTASQITRFLYRTYEKAGGDQCPGADGSELDRAAECLVGLRVAPTTGEATSAAAVTRAQMGVYVIGLWHNLTDKGLPPVPPQLPSTTTTTTTTTTQPPVEPPDTGNDEPDTDGSLYGDILGETTVGDLSWLAALEGTLTVPVFTCGPAGQYAADDVRQATAQLNAGLDGFFKRLTSGRIDLVFSEGAPISINQDFEAARARGVTQELQELRSSIVRDCNRGVNGASAVSINFVITEFSPCGRLGGTSFGCAWLGGNSYVEPDSALPYDNRGLETAIHELAHSVLRLLHLGKSGLGPVLIDEGNISKYGPEGYWNSLTRPPLACYQYKLLGWPVPEGYSEPCAVLPPSSPVIWAADITDDGEVIVRWLPPTYFVDAPITGYTIEIRGVGGGSQRQELPATARTATLRLPNAAKLTGFELDLWANSSEANYGGLVPLGESEPVYSRGASSAIHVAPLPPRVGEISVYDITSSSVGLTWDAEELIRYETEHKTDGARQFHYQIERIASDLPDEDPYTTCPAVSVLQGQRREQAERELSMDTGCNPTNWVRGDTLNFPNDVLTSWSIGETLSGGRAVEAEVSGLDPDTQYTFRVRTCIPPISLALGCSQWRTASASTVGASTLPAPSGMRIASGNDEVSGEWGLVTWDPVPGAEAYEFEVVEDGIIWTLGHSRRLEHSYDLSPLYEIASGAADVKFRIRSCKTWLRSCGDGEWTTVALPSSASRSTPPPYRVSVKEIEGAYTTLGYWTPDWKFVRGGGPYDLEYQYTDGTSDSGLQRRDGYMSYLELPTDPNKNYTVKMRNCDGSSATGGHCSTWTTFAFSTYPVTSSIAPPPVRVTDISGTSFRLAWGHVPGAFSYDWRMELESRFVAGGRVLASDVLTRGSEYVAPEYTPWVPPVEPGKEYTIMVRTCGALTQPCGDWVTTKVST